MIADLLKKNNLSIYQCSKASGIPYTTLSEIVNGKNKISKCSGETLYKLAKVLNVSIEELLEEAMKGVC